MNKNNIVLDKINIITTTVMLGILLFFFCATVMCLGKKINSELFQQEDTEVTIDWAQEYPFEFIKQTSSVETSIFDTIKTKLSVVDNYIQANILFKTEFVYAMNWLEARVGWETECATAYNPVFRLEDNYLVRMQTGSGDLSKTVESIVELKEYCKKKNIDFTYVNLPSKVSKYTDETYDGKYFYSNVAADKLLSALNENNVNYLDISEHIHSDNLDFHSLFFDTDHHWKPETALLASGYVADYLNENYGYSLDKSFFDIKNYNKEVYKEYFMGSLGKKMTTNKVKPDDFSLLYPKFETQLSLEIPSKNLKEEGDLSICYDMSYMEKDYNSANPYATYLSADRPVIKLRNSMAQDKHKILILKDSYVNAMVPFMALAVSEIDMLDLRHFNGSLKTYIEKEEPDIVLVAYHVEDIGAWTENWLFDFR